MRNVFLSFPFLSFPILSSPMSAQCRYTLLEKWESSTRILYCTSTTVQYSFSVLCSSVINFGYLRILTSPHSFSAVLSCVVLCCWKQKGTAVRADRSRESSSYTRTLLLSSLANFHNDMLLPSTVGGYVAFSARILYCTVKHRRSLRL